MSAILAFTRALPLALNKISHNIEAVWCGHLRCKVFGCAVVKQQVITLVVCDSSYWFFGEAQAAHY
eukprot:17655-Heterococcus_DN1.PRE.1